ncbi:MAG: cysteine--tRNA ligase [Woeseiaceae bacterium]|nr:cysteine--tRNA ligase [Woeseiaceae bacterium]
MQLYDTLRGKKSEFQPLKAGEVTMYLCGPTVYNYPHIGNARPAVVFDVLARLLRRKYKLTFARNITDIDDKINKAALEAGKPINEITEQYITAYNDDMAALGVAMPDVEPRATEHIEQIIDMITTLIDKGHAYEAEGHVLFDVESNPDYGALSGRDLREMIAGARVEVAPYKKNPHDFVLWKPSTPELPGWDSPWGRGRPGWHIECSAMCARHLGRTIDIHGGGLDLVFPHHENELAQSSCAHDGEPFARFWMHNGLLSMESEKMSKSLGNVLLVHELVGKEHGEVIRLALLSAHYRQPLDWSDETLADSRRKLDRLYGAIRGIDVDATLRRSSEPPQSFIDALEDDLNTPKALAELFEHARTLNKSGDEKERQLLAAELLAAGEVVGLLNDDPEDWFAGAGELDAEAIEAMLAKREKARADGDYAQADSIRDELATKGITIEDGAAGTRWRRS